MHPHFFNYLLDKKYPPKKLSQTSLMDCLLKPINYIVCKYTNLWQNEYTKKNIKYLLY